MRKITLFVLAFTFIITFSCKKERKDPEPGYILQKWSRAIEKLDYTDYSKCEAYPKSEQIFRDIYRDEYFTDIMVVHIEKPDTKKIIKDYEENSYIERKVTFEGAVVKRSSKKPFQAVAGDVVFIKFLDGKRSAEGWLIFNRTITRTNR